MLKPKQFNENDVVTLKLSTSEEIFGRFKGRDDDGSYLIEKPLQLMPNEQGQVGLAPALHTVGYDVTVAFMAQNIVAAVHTENQLKDNYIKATTNIQPANQMPGGDTGSGSGGSVITGT